MDSVYAAEGSWVKNALVVSLLPLTVTSLLSMQAGGQRNVPLFGAASLLALDLRAWPD